MHLDGKFADIDECGQCREWYVHDIVPIYPFSFCFNPATFSSERLLKENSLEEIEKNLASILKGLTEAVDKTTKSFLLTWIESSLENLQFMSSVFSELYYNLGDVLMEQGKAKEALGLWENVLKENPSHPQIHARLEELLTQSSNA